MDILISFEDLVASNQRPDLILIDPSSVVTRSVSEMKQMTQQEVRDGDFIQVCDSMEWLASSKDHQGRISYLSSDGVLVWQFPIQRTIALGYRMNASGKLELSENNNLEFTNPQENNKEEQLMSQETSSSIDDLINQVAPSPAPAPAASAGPANMTAFDGSASAGGTAAASSGASAAASAESKKWAEEASSRIKAVLDSERSQLDDSQLRKAWNNTAELLFWITPNDARDVLGVARRRPPKEEWDIIANAPESEKDKFKKDPGSVDKKYIKTELEVKAQRSKPSLPKGVVIKVPAYLKGMSIADYAMDVALKGPTSEAEGLAVNEMLPIEDFEQKLSLVGTRIKESPQTHENPGVTMIQFRPSSVRKDREKVRTASVLNKNFVRVGRGRKTVYTNTNYFPLTVYETHDIYGTMSPEVVADLNIAYFLPLFNVGKTTSVSKYNQLAAEFQQVIRKDDNSDNITTPYITTGADRVTFQVKDFFESADSKTFRPTIELPMKRREQKEDGTWKTPSFVKYSVIADVSKMSQDDANSFLSKTSWEDARFANLREIASDVMTLDSLRDMFKRGSGGTASKVYLSDNHVIQLMRDLVQGKAHTKSIQVRGMNYNVD